MAKAGACQKMEKPAVVVEEWKSMEKKVNCKGDVKMLYDTILPAFGFLAVCLLIYREAQKW